MTDNVTLNPGIGGAVVATDEIGGAQYQRIKLIHGADGVNAGDVSSSNPLPVTGPLTNAQFRAAPTSIVLADGAQLSAFGKLNVTTTHTIFDCQNEYGLDTLRVWDATANGVLALSSPDGSVVSGSNAVGPTNLNSRMTPISVSNTDGHYSILQSRQYCRYVPGKGNVTFITGVFAAGAGATAAITWRSSTSGSVSNVTVQQADWSEDTFGLTAKNPSGFTIDFTKIQILVIDAQMLYAGRVRIGFDIDGCIHWAHYFEIANNFSLPTMQTYNLPVRIEGRTDVSSTSFNWGRFDSANGIFLSTTRTTKGGTVNFECCSVQSNGDDELRGFPQSVGNGVNTISVSTRRPILSIQPKTTFNSRTNRAHIEELLVDINVGSGSAYWELVIDGTLTGHSFGSVSPNSVAEFDTSATQITGGGTILSGYISSGGSVRESATAHIDGRSPLVLSKIDELAAHQIPVSLVMTALSGSVTAAGAFNWHEQIV